MTVRATTLQNRPEGVPAEDHRLIRAYFLPPAAGGLHAFSGVLPAPAGYLGEVTLLAPETVRVNPARWVIAGTQAGTQGDYVVANDAPVERAIGARDATLSRLDRLVVSVRDTAYTPNEGADDPDVRVIPGTPALTGAVLPPVPPNSLVLGSFTVPPGSGTVTFTPTIVPQQVPVGGVQPVRSGETLTDGGYDGQLRDHPTLGLQRWSAALSQWGPMWVDRFRTRNVTDLDLTSTGHPWQIGVDGAPNLAGDRNQLQARDGVGGHATLFLNSEAAGDGSRGDVGIGPATVRGALTGSQAEALVAPRVRVLAATDAAAKAADGSGTASTQHGFQIGPDDGNHVIMDTNEGYARSANGRISTFAWHGLLVDEPTDNQAPLRRLDFDGPLLRVIRTSTGGVTNATWVPVTWDADAYDTFGMWSSGANVVSKRAGYYWLTAGFAVAANVGGRRGIRIVRDGVTQPIGRLTGTSGTSVADYGVEASGLLYLDEGAVLTVQIYQDSGATQSVSTLDQAACVLAVAWQRGPSL